MRARTRRIVLALTTVLVLALAAAAYYAWDGAGILAGYSAKTLCTCVFVAGREPASCLEQELEAYRSVITATVHREARAVDTRALLLRRAHARFRDRLGCALD